MVQLVYRRLLTSCQPRYTCYASYVSSTASFNEITYADNFNSITHQMPRQLECPLFRPEIL